MKNIIALLAFIVCLRPNPATANDAQKPKHQEEAETHQHVEGDKHQEDEHGHGDEEEHEEEASNAGPDKGVTTISKDGFTLSPEAFKTFEIKTQKVDGAGPWTLPKSCLLLTGEEKNIFRIRNQAFKRIDVEVLKKINDSAVIQSTEIKSGDEIVVQGVGFLRIAELDATSGESGHHH